MIQKVYSFVKQHNMIEAGDKIIAGVSGGADSVCLLMVLKELQSILDFEMVVVHIEHGIRGEESIRDAQHVEKLCHEMGIEFEICSYKVGQIAKELKLTIEEAGRKVRYETFEKMQKKYGANKIAVAHNMNDNAETVIINLIRGSGLSGIHGIVPVRDNIIRPVLCLTRDEIEEYLSKKGLKYCIDSTNLENDYTRNKIRNSILKTMKEEINPKVINHIFDTSKIILEAEQFIQNMVYTKMDECCIIGDSKVKIDIEKFREYDVVLKKEIIRESIKQVCKSIKDFGNTHIESVLELENMNSGKMISLPAEIIAEKSFGYIEITKQKSVGDFDIYLPLDLEGITVVDKNKELKITARVFERSKEFSISKKMYTKCFDYDKIKGDLVIRNKKDNDTIVINDKGNRQKLKKYFISEKIPKDERKKVLIIADEEDVLWIIGHRISEKYKITDSTQKILELQMKGVQDNV